MMKNSKRIPETCMYKGSNSTTLESSGKYSVAPISGLKKYVSTNQLIT